MKKTIKGKTYEELVGEEKAKIWKENQRIKAMGNKHGFKKGNHPATEFKKGHKNSEETSQKMSLARKGMVSNMKGKHHTEEAKRKIGLKSIGNKYSLGYKQTEEHKRNISLGNKGKPKSEEHKRNISLAKKGMNTGEKNPNYGKHFTPETRQKMSEAKKGENNYWYGKHFSPEHKQKIGLKSKGKHPSEETIQKQREAKLNKHPSEETKAKISLAIKEIKKSKEARMQMKEYRSKQISPKKDTKIELKIQNYLKELGIEFFTHQYINIEHGYQCDIFIPSLNMVIECDGVYWHKYPTGREIDHIRTKELIEKGFKVLRLWEINIVQMSLEEFKEILNKQR